MNKKEKERKETLIRSIDSKWYVESEIIQFYKEHYKSTKGRKQKADNSLKKHSTSKDQNFEKLPVKKKQVVFYSSSRKTIHMYNVSVRAEDAKARCNVA